MGSGSDVDLQNVYAQYIQKYGQDNADYLMEVMGAWQQHYQRAAYVDLDGPGASTLPSAPRPRPPAGVGPSNGSLAI